METQPGKPAHPLVWVAAIALIVLCGAGVSAMMGWIPTSMSKPETEKRVEIVNGNIQSNA